MALVDKTTLHGLKITLVDEISNTLRQIKRALSTAKISAILKLYEVVRIDGKTSDDMTMIP